MNDDSSIGYIIIVILLIVVVVGFTLYLSAPDVVKIIYDENDGKWSINYPEKETEVGRGKDSLLKTLKENLVNPADLLK